MRPLHVSHSDGLGGADIAAYRIHRSLLGSDTDSRMAVAVRTTDDPTVVSLPQQGGVAYPWLRRNLTDAALWTQKSANGTHRSTNAVPSGALPFLSGAGASLLHLHWLGSDTLSVAEIGRLAGPVVWTLHDSWPFCGAEHHPEDADDQRFAEGYTRASRRPGSSRFDLDASVYRRKRRHWRRSFHLAAPSRYMADQAAASVLAHDWPMRVIPNPLDTDVFAPVDPAWARASFGLPPEAPVILFGAMGAVANKGWDLLQPALLEVARAVPSAIAVVFGQDPPARLPDAGMPLHFTGRIADPVRLAALYSAADVMVVPSRLESFSQTASEAQSCGTPVVAFATSGLLDVVAPGETGLLAEPFSSRALAASIVQVLSDADLRRRLGVQARSRAVEAWSMPVVAQRYLEWYDEAIAAQRTA